MGGEHYIETPFDVLLSALKEAAEPISAGRLALIAGMREKDAVEWLHVLEKSGQVKIENRFNAIYVSWIGKGEAKKSSPAVSPAAIEASSSAFESDLRFARQREEGAMPAQQEKKRRAVPVEPESVVDVGGSRLGSAGRMVHELQSSIAKKQENTIDAIEREAMENEEAVEAESFPMPDFGREPLGEKEEAQKSDDAPDIEEEALAGVPDAQERESWRKEGKEEGERANEGKTPPFVRTHVPRKGMIRPKFAAPVKIAKMKKPSPVEITGVTLQFSERIERQMKRIERQSREIDALRQEKEKLLAEHYLPLQHRLESELETISDRVMRVQGKVAGMQKSAADLPAQVSSVEKVQVSSVKAHGEMRRAYGEACALLEESGRQLAEEREKMEIILEQSREELSRHSAMSGELKNTLERIEGMEGEAASRVSEARAALAEQAERLASAEAHAGDLRALRSEMGESILEMKREVASAKRVLGDLERQMGQMRQVEEYASGIRKEYDARMLEIDDYIKNGNREFEALRESVEANFVRRYLRELRSLTDSYSFEFGQARKMEGDIDARISEERRKLESLFEEGKKISYLFETQSRAPEGAEKFETRAETFRAMDEVSSNRSQIAQMISQVIGGRSEHLSPRAIRASAASEPIAIKPIGISRVKAHARRKKKAKPVRKAKAPVRKTKRRK
ncbi:MAG: hypothetical protein WC717_01510 [Candidatus Micrarchaeia archaeon]|jgi:hypothetical protein